MGQMNYNVLYHLKRTEQRKREGNRTLCQCQSMVPAEQSVTMAGDGRTTHIVLFPFPAQGHFAAFLSLAVQLHRARPSAAITLVSTPANVAALRAGASATLPFLRFHALPFAPEEHGLPAGCESMDALSRRTFQIHSLFKATDSPQLRAAFDDFVVTTVAAAGDSRGGLVVVADPFLAWTTAVARRSGAGHAVFVSCGAFGSAVYHSLWNHLPHLRDSGEAFHLPDHPEVTVQRSQISMPLQVADGMDWWSGFHRRQIEHAYDTDALLVNTTEELEPIGLRMLRRAMRGAPVWPVGPLVRAPTHERRSDRDSRDGNIDSIVTRWLDAREAARSVLYVSFGSQNSLRREQMTELAAALELTGRPFVWAIRPPVPSSNDENTTGTQTSANDTWLPEGFEERVRGNNTGLLVRGWAPQVAILAHASTGAFLSHCGWNSAMESMAHGVPVLGWPLVADQFYNAKVLDEEWGVCVEVGRGNDADSPVVERARLAEVVEMVLGAHSAKGIEMRRRAAELQELVRGAQSDGGSSVQAMEAFFSSLQLRGTTSRPLPTVGEN